LKGTLKGERFDKKKQHLRMLGQVHFLLKLGYELGLEKRSTFMDMPISEMTHGRQAIEQINLIRHIPVVGNATADAVKTMAGISTSQPYRAKQGMHMDDVHINGTANYIISNHPWSRVLKDASAAAMLYNMTYLDRMSPEMRKEYSSSEYEPLPDVWKIMDAIGGIRIIADNPQARKARVAYDIKKRREEATRRAGITSTINIETTKEQQ
jgi:hypothetical protein